MKPTLCTNQQCLTGRGSLRCFAVASLVFAALAFASGAFAQAGQEGAAAPVEEGVGESDAGPSTSADGEASAEPEVEEALQVLSESRSDCSCGNGTQMFFWLPSVEQKKFLERLEGVKIRDDLVSHIILWCTKNKKIEMPEDELDSLFGRAFNWKPSKI